MRYKIVLNFFTVFLFLTFLNLSVHANSFSNSQEKHIIEMLNSFYKSYVEVMSRADRDDATIDFLMSEYVTVALQDKISLLNLNYDPILNTQDFSFGWLNPLTIQKSKLENNVYLVSYTDTSTEQIITILLTIVEDDKRYKINDIKGMVIDF